MSFIKKSIFGTFRDPWRGCDFVCDQISGEADQELRRRDTTFKRFFLSKKLQIFLWFKVWDESYLDLPKYLMSEFCQTRARGWGSSQEECPWAKLFSSNSTIRQNGKTMLFLGGLYEIRQPPTCLCTTSNFITNNTTTETFQAGHLSTISGEKYHRQVKLYRDDRQGRQDVLSGQTGETGQRG